MSDTITAKGSDAKFTPHPEGQYVGQCVDTVRARFYAKVIPEPNTGCLLWMAAGNRAGYGLINVEGRSTLAHRLSWELDHVWPVPNGMCVLHRCDTPACVNPDHLFLGTDADNVRDKIAKGRQRFGNHNALKTHCVNGHAFDEANTYVRPDGGGRVCKRCALLRRQEQQTS